MAMRKPSRTSWSVTHVSDMRSPKLSTSVVTMSDGAGQRYSGTSSSQMRSSQSPIAAMARTTAGP